MLARENCMNTISKKIDGCNKEYEAKDTLTSYIKQCRHMHVNQSSTINIQLLVVMINYSHFWEMGKMLSRMNLWRFLCVHQSLIRQGSCCSIWLYYLIIPLGHFFNNVETYYRWGAENLDLCSALMVIKSFLEYHCDTSYSYFDIASRSRAMLFFPGASIDF